MRNLLAKLGRWGLFVALGIFVGVAGLRFAQLVAPAPEQSVARGFIGHTTGGDFFGTRASGGGSVVAGSGITVAGSTVSVDFAVAQARVVDTCPAGSAIRAIAADATITCETDDNAGGDITAVTAGTGLSGGAASGAASLALLYPNAGLVLYDDVMSCSTTGNMGGLPIAVSGAGAGCIAATTTAAAARPSVLGLSAGTTATGRSAWASTGTLFFDSTANWIYETLVSPQALSDGTNTWTWRGGFCDVISGADCVDGVYFEYDQSADTHWRCKTAANSVRTATNSTVTATVNTYDRLRITLTEDSSALFEVNGVTVCGGAIATNIPSGSARATFFSPGVTNSTAGSVNTRAMDTDYWFYAGTFDTSR